MKKARRKWSTVKRLNRLRKKQEAKANNKLTKQIL
jgi:hypothetical protein